SIGPARPSPGSHTAARITAVRAELGLAQRRIPMHKVVSDSEYRDAIRGERAATFGLNALRHRNRVAQSVAHVRHSRAISVCSVLRAVPERPEKAAVTTAAVPAPLVVVPGTVAAGEHV